jgi:hypothetical protein
MNVALRMCGRGPENLREEEAMDVSKIVWSQRERVFEIRGYRVYKSVGSPWGYHVAAPVFSRRQSKDSYPLAPGREYTFIEPVYLAVRLYETVGRKLCYWIIEEKARECLNQAPFQPIWRGWVARFAWAPEGKEFAQEREYVLSGAWDVLQGSNGGWWIWGAKMAEDQAPWMKAGEWRDPVPTIAGVLDRLKPTWYACQGHLTVYRVEQPFQDCGEREWPRERVRFYNHVVARGVMLGRTATRMCVYTRESTWLLSPDHYEEPVRLEPGYWILEHPLPRGNGDID